MLDGATHNQCKQRTFDRVALLLPQKPAARKRAVAGVICLGILGSKFMSYLKRTTLVLFSALMLNGASISAEEIHTDRHELW